MKALKFLLIAALAALIAAPASAAAPSTVYVMRHLNTPAGQPDPDLLPEGQRAAEALAVYRTLGPRLSALSSTDDRARTFLEAAELAFSLGPDALDDAIAFLGESKQLAGRDLEWRCPTCALA